MHDPWNRDSQRGRTYPIVIAVVLIVAASIGAAWVELGGGPTPRTTGSEPSATAHRRVTPVDARTARP